MTKVTYRVETLRNGVYEDVPTISKARELVEKYGGQCRVVYTEIKAPTPPITDTKAEWLKSGKKPLHPYKGV